MSEKVAQQKQCKHCQTPFAITDKDIEFYDKVSPIFGWKKFPIPSPTLCPDCRQQRRLSFRNERKLYHSTCASTHKNMLSIYSPDKPYTVYSQDAWRSDSWSGFDYGQDFDFTKPFFPQFAELLLKVPKISNLVKNSTNCEYNVVMGNCKDCYMCSTTFQSEGCMYSCRCVESNHCVDTYNVLRSENSYECFDTLKVYNLHFAESCEECSDSYFLYDCIWCKNCCLCTGLRNKQYCRWNQQLSKEDYEKKVEEILPLTHGKIAKLREQFNALKMKQIRKHYTGIQTTNSQWDYLTHCKNCSDCFNVSDGEDVKFARDSCVGLKDCMDVSMIGDIVELMLEAHASGYQGYKSAFVNLCRTNSELLYCDYCMNCQNCFGCAGLKNQQYCILNTQYTKPEYETLVGTIIDHMQTTGERGEFFPSSIAPFGYNETVANEYYPLTKEEALNSWFLRSDYEAPFPKVAKTLQPNEVPQNIELVSDAILQQAIICEISGKPFRITKEELEFYRNHKLPIPKIHPDQRYKARIKLGNPKHLRERTCDKCGIDIKTTYAPDRKEIVYCEACYNKEIYW